jgi:hypothetical protein
VIKSVIKSVIKMNLCESKGLDVFTLN